MRALVLALVLSVLGACADVVEGEELDSGDEVAVSTSALLANGCYGYLSIKSMAPGVIYSPYSTGRVWEFASTASSNCYYTTAGYDFLYSSQTYPGQCGQYDARTWYCDGAGVFTCPNSATLARPTGGADQPFGPYTTFNRNYPSYGAETVLPFSHSYFDGETKRVACAYRTDYAVYRYSK